MTKWPRVFVSMTPDIQKTVDDMRKKPGSERVPMSQLLSRLKENAETPTDGDA